jgi:hypothetical protein
MKLKATQKLAMKGLEGAASWKSKVHASYIYCKRAYLTTFPTSLLSPESMGPAYAPGMLQARVGVPESDPPYSGPKCPIYIVLSYKFIHTRTQTSHDESNF